MAPKKERDEALNDFSSRIFSAMLEEVLMDVVLQSHQEIARFKSVCDVCHTRCNSAHNPGSSTMAASGSQQSELESQANVDNMSASAPGTGANTPNANGTAYFDCTNCGRQIASNRYAPHLSSCMGLGNSRRGAARNSTSKARLDAGRSASPYVAPDLGNLSDDSKSTTKGKGKSKAKQADDAEFSLHRKRVGSPSVSPAKKSKKAKTAISRVRSESDLSGPPPPLPLSHTNSQSKIPSKLRESSILSFDRRSSTPDSQFSSPALSASTPSAFSTMQSPILPGASIPGKTKPKNGQAALNGTPSMRFSPPQKPPAVVRGTDDYFVDVEGEETGSSTDSDSD